MKELEKLAEIMNPLKNTVQKLPVLIGSVVAAGKAFAEDLGSRKNNEEGEITMKKSTLISLIVFLSAVAGALGAAYLYLKKREKELDEYEQMLFSEEYEDDCAEEDCGCCDCCDVCEEVEEAEEEPAE